MRLPSGTNSSEWGLDPPPRPRTNWFPPRKRARRVDGTRFGWPGLALRGVSTVTSGPGVRDVPVRQSNRWGQALLTCDCPGLKKPGFLIDEFCAGDSWADGADGIRLKMGGGTWRRNPPWMSNGARRQQDAPVLGFSSTNGTSAPSGYREPV